MKGNLGSVSRKSARLPRPWQRSTKRRPCAVCNGIGCIIAGKPSSPAAAVCSKVESGRPVGTIGHLHVLRTDGPTWAPWRASLPRLAKLEAHRGR